MPNGVRRILILAIAFILLTGAVDAQVLHHVSRNDVSFLNPRGAAVLSGQTAQVLGGVILQGEVSFSDANGASIPQKAVILKNYNLSSGILSLRYAEDVFSYRVDKETFDRVFSWVQNDGTGLYTAYPLTIEQRKEGGFSECDTSGRTWRTSGFIATEFSTSAKHVRWAAFIDFAGRLGALRSTERDADIMARHNTGLQPNRSARGLHWVVSDLDSDFVAKLANGAVQISGTLYEYSRQTSKDRNRVYVSGVKEFATELSGNEAEGATHRDALAFARTVALLRALHRHSPASWSTFSQHYFVQTKKY